MQYFDIYIDSMKGIYTYSDKNDEYEVGENVKYHTTMFTLLISINLIF